eukprot:TRINITY_DN15279_c0_g1_i1.p1 TRINITY_DN15279_c0_g1~~TRINITY_DN15279_c0_g1_i1.p1  ORF type:complete len:646 (-),score=87.95 TRINITY_DN15279_c0_g1_i1:58-1995(-)
MYLPEDVLGEILELSGIITVVRMSLCSHSLRTNFVWTHLRSISTAGVKNISMQRVSDLLLKYGGKMTRLERLDLIPADPKSALTSVSGFSNIIATVGTRLKELKISHFSSDIASSIDPTSLEMLEIFCPAQFAELWVLFSGKKFTKLKHLACPLPQNIGGILAAATGSLRTWQVVYLAFRDKCWHGPDYSHLKSITQANPNLSQIKLELRSSACFIPEVMHRQDANFPDGVGLLDALGQIIPLQKLKVNHRDFFIGFLLRMHRATYPESVYEEAWRICHGSVTPLEALEVVGSFHKYCNVKFLEDLPAPASNVLERILVEVLKNASELQNVPSPLKYRHIYATFLLGYLYEARGDPERALALWDVGRRAVSQIPRSEAGTLWFKFLHDEYGWDMYHYFLTDVDFCDQSWFFECLIQVRELFPDHWKVPPEAALALLTHPLLLTALNTTTTYGITNLLSCVQSLLQQDFSTMEAAENVSEVLKEALKRRALKPAAFARSPKAHSILGAASLDLLFRVFGDCELLEPEVIYRWFEDDERTFRKCGRMWTHWQKYHEKESWGHFRVNCMRKFWLGIIYITQKHPEVIGSLTEPRLVGESFDCIPLRQEQVKSVQKAVETTECLRQDGRALAVVELLCQLASRRKGVEG